MISWLLLAAAMAGDPTQLMLGGMSVSAEVADTPRQRASGLMGRVSLPTDSGMLFVYPGEAPRSFWMKNTPIALSIAFMDTSGRIVHIADLEPLNEAPVASVHPAMYALEMTQGWFREHGVMVGQTVAGLPEASAR